MTGIGNLQIGGKVSIAALREWRLSGCDYSLLNVAEGS
jgi:hypothetical protein